MCVEIACVLNTTKYTPSLLIPPPHRLRSHGRGGADGRGGLTSLSDLDHSCLVSILLIPIGQMYVNNGMMGMAYELVTYTVNFL